MKSNKYLPFYLLIVFVLISCAGKTKIESMQTEIDRLKIESMQTQIDELKAEVRAFKAMMVTSPYQTYPRQYQYARPPMAGSIDESSTFQQKPAPGKLGMTWGTYIHENFKGYVDVSCMGEPKLPNSDKCNAYQGDTLCTQKLPLLCINKNRSLPQPEDLPLHGNNIWSGGEVKLVKNVLGTKLTSHEAADEICSKNFGKGWQMAGHEDGTGWGFWAKGTIDTSKRFWVSISDQPSNCWGQDTARRYGKGYQ